MIVNNSHLCLDDVEKVNKLISTIPKNLIPKTGMPLIYLTKSLFHSFCLMYRKHRATGEKNEEEFFDFCRNHGVWAFSCMPINDSGEIYLALEKRIEKGITLFSIEHTIFHEIGHLFHYGNGIKIKGSADIGHETLSDIYANACMINLFNEGFKNGLFNDIKESSIKIMSELNKTKTSKLLFTAELIHRKYGVL